VTVLALWFRRVAAEVEGDVLGEEFKGYVFKIMGGQDKQVRGTSATGAGMFHQTCAGSQNPDVWPPFIVVGRLLVSMGGGDAGGCEMGVGPVV
jgi:hypothetical protein